MFSKTAGFVVIPLWLAAMGWLVAHDVWPRWSAQDAGPRTSAEWIRAHGEDAQQTIYDQFGPVGKIWTINLVDEQSIRREDLILIERLPVPITTPLKVVVSSALTADGVLDEITVKMHSADVDLRLHGERFHADFSFELVSGPMKKTFKVPLVDGRMISASLNPLSDLASAQPGQSWRVQVVNPLALLTGVGSRFSSVLVTVGEREEITTEAWSGMCLRIEGGKATAWVDENGVVQLQEVALPLVGKLRMVRDREVDLEARARVRHRRLPRAEKEDRE